MSDKFAIPGILDTSILMQYLVETSRDTVFSDMTSNHVPFPFLDPLLQLL